ncbi:MAG: hypothetical protein ACYDH5_18100 [Acidimicrobiales bacterium]
MESPSHGWTGSFVMALVGGMVALVGFWLVERARAARGRSVMLAPSLVATAPMRAGLAAAAVCNFGLYGMLIVFSVTLQQQRHYSALLAGLAFLPLTVIGAGTSGLLAGRLTAAHGPRPARASGVLNAARQIGGVLGIALLGSIAASSPARLPVALAIAATAFAVATAVVARWSITAPAVPRNASPHA